MAFKTMRASYLKPLPLSSISFSSLHPPTHPPRLPLLHLPQLSPLILPCAPSLHDDDDCRRLSTATTVTTTGGRGASGAADLGGVRPEGRGRRMCTPTTPTAATTGRRGAAGGPRAADVHADKADSDHDRREGRFRRGGSGRVAAGGQRAADVCADDADGDHDQREGRGRRAADCGCARRPRHGDHDRREGHFRRGGSGRGASKFVFSKRLCLVDFLASEPHVALLVDFLTTVA